MISVCLYLLFTSFVTSSVFPACSSRSEWIFTKLCELLAPLELSIMMIVRLKKKKRLFRNKALSDGAILFYLDHLVSTRVSKDPLSISHTTRLTQATNIGLETRSPLFLGVGGSVDLSVLSYSYPK